MNCSKRRKQKGIQWADAIALSLAMLLFLGALGYYWYSKREPAEQVELQCALLISGLERTDWETYGDQWMKEGDHLYSSNGTVMLGRLERVEAREHFRIAVRDGEAVWEAHPFLTDVEVTVRISATHRAGDGLRTGDLRIAAGGRGDFRFGGLLAGAEILEVREVETA